MEFAFVYAAIITISMITVYAVCRLIDHFLTNRENDRRCVYAEYLIPKVGEQVKELSEETINHIVDKMIETTKAEEP